MKLTKYMKEAFIRRVMNDVPQIDYDEQIRSLAMADAVEQLPPSVRTVWDDPKLRGYVRTTGEYLAKRYHYVPLLDDGKHSDAAKAAAAELLSLNEAQSSKLAVLKQGLTATAFSVTTRKALAAMLPEFEKYLPEDEAAALRSLPVVANVMAGFVEAGWPKPA